MTTFAVTAASGQLGRLAVEALLERGVAPADVVAVVRTPAKVADLAARGVRVRTGDYSDPASLVGAFDGVDRVLLISGSEPGGRVAQHTNVIEAARAAGVQRIAYTSLLRADTSGNPLAAEHKGTEEVLAASGVPFTLLRNGWYLENHTAQLGRYLQTGEILGAGHDGRISAAARADYAAAAATALLQEEPAGTCELGGDSFTLAELAAAVTRVTGTPVVYRDLSTGDYAAALAQAGLDEGTAGFVAALDASIAAGDLESTSSDLATLVGRPLVTLDEAIRAAHA